MPEGFSDAPAVGGADTQDGRTVHNKTTPTDDDDTPVLVTHAPLSRFMPSSMRDPPFRNPPQSIDDPAAIVTVLTSPLAAEYLTLKLWDIGAEAVTKIIHGLSELVPDKRTTALKEYYTEMIAAVNSLDAAVKSWTAWGAQQRSATDKTSYGTIVVVNNITLSRYEVFLSNLHAVQTFRNDEQDNSAFSSKWKVITEKGARQPDLQAALDSVTSYQSKAQDISNLVKTCSAMLAAGLSDCQSDISTGGGHVASATKALKTAFEADPVPPSAITVV